jgi:hypothetical protein
MLQDATRKYPAGLVLRKRLRGFHGPAPARDDISERDPVEKIVDVTTEIRPQVMRKTGLALLAIALAMAASRVDALVQRIHDLRDTESIGRHAEAITAATPSRTCHQTGTAQARKKLLEVRQGNALPLRDVWQANRTGMLIQREIQQRSDRVMCFGGDPQWLSPAFLSVPDRRCNLANPTKLVKYLTDYFTQDSGFFNYH